MHGGVCVRIATTVDSRISIEIITVPSIIISLSISISLSGSLAVTVSQCIGISATFSVNRVTNTVDLIRSVFTDPSVSQSKDSEESEATDLEYLIVSKVKCISIN